MKKQKKLMDVAQRLDKEEVVKYASNIGCELDESLDVKELRQAYSDYVLAHPKEILIRLPKGDLDAIGRVKKANAQVGKRCWTSARAAHDTALIDTLIDRGVDVSAVYDGESIESMGKLNIRS